MSFVIVADRRAESDFVLAARTQRLQDAASLAVYALATAVAAFSPMAALALFVLVALSYVVPGLFADLSRRRGASRARRQD
jgi:hypothetical protein